VQVSVVILYFDGPGLVVVVVLVCYVHNRGDDVGVYLFRGSQTKYRMLLHHFGNTVAMGQIELDREKQGQTTVVYSTMHP
jgi:hypothetical protein